jgi:mycothiol system anti-sigma-R factor
MSCGGPHEMPCTEVLSAVFLFIDHELEDSNRVSAIEIHLQECPPCHDSFGAEQRVRDLVARCCGGDATPEPLRQRVLERLTEIRFQLSSGDPQ